MPIQIPSSYAAYQVLAFVAGVYLFLAAQTVSGRVAPRWAGIRRFLLELILIGVLGLPFVLLGRVLLLALGSEALFFPVGAIFHAATLIAPAHHLWNLALERRGNVLLLTTYLGMPALGYTMTFVEPERLEVTREVFVFPAERTSTRPVRIAHLTDLQTVGPADRESRILVALEAFDPDLILITGDFATGGLDAEVHARAFLERLHARDGIYVVIGDAEDERELRWLLEGLPITWLDNAGELVTVQGAPLWIGGLSRLVPIPEMTTFGCPEGVPRIVLSHAPDPFVHYEEANIRVDLFLAGHTHGGQIVLPGFGPPLTLSDLPRHYASGRHERQRSVRAVVVGRGIGSEGKYAPRMRLLCPPEIGLFEVRFAVEGPSREGIITSR